METMGIVRIWHGDEGWGIVDSQDTPGGCWAHFSHVAMPGYRALQAGQAVEFEWESAAQDGYSFRATRVWLAGTAPETQAPRADGDPGYTSGLSIRFDD
ncbi:cold-shock protein [Arthrobacter psychrolactophilus]